MSDATRLHRGLVLQALHGQWPLPMPQVTLERLVASLFLEGAALERVLAYLEAKGYLDVEVQEIGTRRIRLFKLTAAGVDLVEQSTQDPGVDLGADG